MKQFVPVEKMSKKARRKLAGERRQIWSCSPVSRRIENKKRYDRKKKPFDRYDDGTWGFFSCC